MSREFAKMQIPGSSNWLGRSRVGPRNLSFNTILTQVVHKVCFGGWGAMTLKILCCSWRMWRERTSHLLGTSGPHDLFPSSLDIFWFLKQEVGEGGEFSPWALSTSAPPSTVLLYPYPSNFKPWVKIHSPSYLVLSLLILTVIPHSKGCGSNCHHFHLLGPC